MTDLELLNAELARQERELEICFEQMRSLDPELTISVSPEWVSEMEVEPAPILPPTSWAIRA